MATPFAAPVSLRPKTAFDALHLMAGTTQVAATLTESGGVVSLTPKSTSDWSTNATITGTNGVRVPYAIVVGVTGRS